MSNRRKVRNTSADDLGPLGPPGDDGGPVAVVLDASGRAVLRPKSVENLTDRQLRAFDDLGHTARALRVGNEQLERNVLTARGRGLSWATIGWAVGLTESAMRKRFAVYEVDAESATDRAEARRKRRQEDDQ